MDRHPSRPDRLLVLACSATKRSDPGPIPALARYDGPLWRTLRAADPEGRRAKVAFLSAHYGFRDAATPIADYDARLTQDLAERMIAGGVTTRWPRSPSPRRPDTYPMATNLTLANSYAHSLAQTLMVAVIVFLSEAGFAVLPADEFEGDPTSVITEFDPHQG